MFGVQGDKSLSLKILISLIAVSVMIPVCVMLCFFGCCFGGYQLRIGG
jgi:hypothetical protein